MPLNVPLRLIAIVWSNSPSSVSATLANFMMPALLTRTSTPPNSPATASNIAAIALGSLTSALTAVARPPASLIFPASLWAASAPPA